MVLHPPVALRELRPLIDEVAQEKEVILGRDGQGIAHECRGIDDESAGHRAGDSAGARISSRRDAAIGNWESSGG